MVVTGVSPSSVIPTALILQIPPKYPRWNLGANLKWKLKQDVCNSVRFIVDTFCFLGREIGSKLLEKNIEPEINLGKLLETKIDIRTWAIKLSLHSLLLLFYACLFIWIMSDKTFPKCIGIPFNSSHILHLLKVKKNYLLTSTT